MSDTVRASDTREDAVPVSVDRLPCNVADEGEEPMGGDPPCWAHLFEDDAPTAER